MDAQKGWRKHKIKTRRRCKTRRPTRLAGGEEKQENTHRHYEVRKGGGQPRKTANVHTHADRQTERERERARRAYTLKQKAGNMRSFVSSPFLGGRGLPFPSLSLYVCARVCLCVCLRVMVGKDRGGRGDVCVTFVSTPPPRVEHTGNQTKQVPVEAISLSGVWMRSFGTLVLYVYAARCQLRKGGRGTTTKRWKWKYASTDELRQRQKKKAKRKKKVRGHRSQPARQRDSGGAGRSETWRV